MATLPEAADNLGQEIKLKRDAVKASEAAAAKAADEKLKAQQDHEKNKKQGMI
jgi:hypothetical protein